MSAADDINALFTSGCTLATATATTPCDLFDAVAVQQGEDGVGPFVKRTVTVYVRTGALPDLDADVAVTFTDEYGTEKQYTLQGPPLRIQDGAVSEVTLQESE